MSIYLPTSSWPAIPFSLFWTQFRWHFLTSESGPHLYHPQHPSGCMCSVSGHRCLPVCRVYEKARCSRVELAYLLPALFIIYLRNTHSKLLPPKFLLQCPFSQGTNFVYIETLLPSPHFLLNHFLLCWHYSPSTQVCIPHHSGLTLLDTLWTHNCIQLRYGRNSLALSLLPRYFSSYFSSSL